MWRAFPIREKLRLESGVELGTWASRNFYLVESILSISGCNIIGRGSPRPDSVSKCGQLQCIHDIDLPSHEHQQSPRASFKPHGAAANRPKVVLGFVGALGSDSLLLSLDVTSRIGSSADWQSSPNILRQRSFKRIMRVSPFAWQQPCRRNIRIGCWLHPSPVFLGRCENSCTLKTPAFQDPHRTDGWWVGAAAPILSIHLIR